MLQGNHRGSQAQLVQRMHIGMEGKTAPSRHQVRRTPNVSTGPAQAVPPSIEWKQLLPPHLVDGKSGNTAQHSIPPIQRSVNSAGAKGQLALAAAAAGAGAGLLLPVLTHGLYSC